MISSHNSRVGARKARQWARPRFTSIVCGPEHFISTVTKMKKQNSAHKLTSSAHRENSHLLLTTEEIPSFQKLYLVSTPFPSSSSNQLSTVHRTPRFFLPQVVTTLARRKIGSHFCPGANGKCCEKKKEHGGEAALSQQTPNPREHLHFMEGSASFYGEPFSFHARWTAGKYHAFERKKKKKKNMACNQGALTIYACNQC